MKLNLIISHFLFFILFSFSAIGIDSIKNPTNNSTFSNQNLTDWMTVIISICSFFFTFWQAYIQRTHNKKSIKPIGKIDIGDYENKIFISIVNNGIGPLIVKNLSISYGNIRSNTSLIEVLPNDLSQRILWSDFASNIEGNSILPSNSIYLLLWDPINYLEIQNTSEREQLIKKDRKDLRKALRNLNISLVYMDIYEDKEFTAELPNETFNSWFGRHDK